MIVISLVTFIRIDLYNMGNGIWASRDSLCRYGHEILCEK